MEYPNLPRTIGMVLSTKAATLADLQTVYSLEDVYDLLEVATVDAHNRRIMDKARERDKP